MADKYVSPLPPEYGGFTCPKCGGHYFGTYNANDPEKKWIRFCHGCDFTWKLRDDRKYGLT